MAFRAAPDRQGSSPIAITRYRPVNIVVEPITKAATLNSLWMPIRLCILTQQRIFNSSGADIPRRLCVIDQNCVAAPAMRIGVLILSVLKH